MGCDIILGDQGELSGTIELLSHEEAVVGFTLIRCVVEPRLIVSSALVGCLLAPFAGWLGFITLDLTPCVRRQQQQWGGARAASLLQVIQPLLLLPIIYNNHGYWRAFSRPRLDEVSQVVATW